MRPQTTFHEKTDYSNIFVAFPQELLGGAAYHVQPHHASTDIGRQERKAYYRGHWESIACRAEAEPGLAEHSWSKTAAHRQAKLSSAEAKPSEES